MLVTDLQAILMAAGHGTRLHPFTKYCPKCLMPIHGKPLLEYWLCILKRIGCRRVLVNTHHHRDLVQAFLSQDKFTGWVTTTIEKILLGTAGTIRENANWIKKETLLMAHADNWCHANFDEFVHFHFEERPADSLITMMTFDTLTPESCGIVRVDHKGVVQEFHEKVKDPPGNMANGAIYLIEPEVVNWITDNPRVKDFSSDVLPNFLGRIATWHNATIHRDIGVPRSLLQSQFDPAPKSCWPYSGKWAEGFQKNLVHTVLRNSLRRDLND